MSPWTLCISQAAITKAGANASSVITISQAALARFSDEAESEICTRSKYDWITNYSKVGASYKPLLASTASDLIAIKMIEYDMSNFTSRAEGELMINILDTNAGRNIEMFKDKDIQRTMGVT